MVSARTRAEMEFGAGRTRAAWAWELADRYERKFNSAIPYTDGSYVNVSAVSDTYQANDPGWMLVATYYRSGGEPISFDPEPVDVFPSDELKTKLMLVIG